ncbi:hypothetical protein [Shewanella aestuarii]|uniref:Uncharacterized protein n=1 Tax=Shewanella aestuarii TaxID=1028752 RepID=A0A6G9QRD8_9GAMM|nr:hypothetical protein [Shewanella aestuarii]QIR16597.1 hypothetical protein HBH39_19165 [Shewanella aestuarii]
MHDVNSLTQLKLNLEQKLAANTRAIMSFIDTLTSKIAYEKFGLHNVLEDTAFKHQSANYGLFEFLRRHSTDDEKSSRFYLMRMLLEMERLGTPHSVDLRNDGAETQIYLKFGNDQMRLGCLCTFNSHSTHSKIYLTVCDERIDNDKQANRSFSQSLQCAYLKSDIDLTSLPSYLTLDKSASDILDYDKDVISPIVFQAFVHDALMHPDNLERFNGLFGGRLLAQNDRFTHEALRELAQSHSLDSIPKLSLLPRIANLDSYTGFYLGESTTAAMSHELVRLLETHATTDERIELHATCQFLKLYEAALARHVLIEHEDAINELKNCLELNQRIESVLHDDSDLEQSDTANPQSDVFHINNSL